MIEINEDTHSFNMPQLASEADMSMREYGMRR